jgi:twitching motility protein PilT
MDLVEAMAQGLTRRGASEFAVTSGRLPCVKVNGAFEAIGQEPVSTDLILIMLVTLGGLKYVDSLGSEPSQWRTELDGLGPLRVVAVRAGEVVKARIVTDAGRRPAPSADAAPRQPAPKVEKPPAHTVADDLVFDLVDEETPAVIELSRTPPRVQAPPPAAHSAPAPSPAAHSAPAPSPAVHSAPAPPPAVHSAPAGSPASRSALATLLAEARRRSASDLHVVASRPPLYRVASELLPQGGVLEPHEVEEMLLATVPARLRASFEKDGTADFSLEAEQLGRFRVNVTRQRTGLKGCFRLIGREVPTLETLGLPSSIGQALEHHQGLIVLTGPTGHGKTSTLAALLDLINSTTTHHVITVEDPVEYVHPPKRAMISQREVGTHTRSFAAALKASLREDPDVIAVGELRDTETVRMAIAASETGHLVLGTMNTPSAAKTIDRLIDLFPPGDQPQVRMTLAGGLRLVVSQRLVQSADQTRVHAAAEILPGSMALWNLIRDAKTYQIPSLQQRGKSLGIVRLDDSLGELVQSGKVTLAAALAYAEAPDELATQLGKKGG